MATRELRGPDNDSLRVRVAAFVGGAGRVGAPKLMGRDWKELRGLGLVLDGAELEVDSRGDVLPLVATGNTGTSKKERDE